MTKYKKAVLADIGPDAPWPGILMLNGEPHTHIITMLSPVEVLMEVMGEEYPTPESFLKWHSDFKTALANCEYFMTRYRNAAGEVIWVHRFPETRRCDGCGSTLTAQDPTAEQAARGVETVFFCEKCQIGAHRMTREWSEKHGLHRRRMKVE